MEKVTQINLLYDFYGQLLTEKQQRFIELYYGDDLSLGEIAEQFLVTRQAVHDTLKRSEQTLFSYEEKLGLVGKHLAERKLLSDVMNKLSSYQASKQPALLVEAQDILGQMLDTL